MSSAGASQPPEVNVSGDPRTSGNVVVPSSNVRFDQKVLVSQSPPREGPLRFWT